ncbi:MULTISPECIES: TorF family putative porin [unclassified Phenylobacterium]|uniref:TorF family putative porin n=1 Tax=unclassified Phenylobacterium TaxID=2640670 RepID=UPI00226535F5|nr:TorF family putative porin [Phenylobacterium sp. 58.2.17]MCX7585390.1 TorF family putative porin [Phenylobacterium sp. 58.2.17]
MKTLTTALLAAAATAAMSGAAFAQDESPLDLSFNVGAATDYVWRGVSQTDESPQIYGGVDATVGMVYAGTWLSNVDFGTGNDTDFELDLYAGIRPQLGPVALDLGIQYYGYINAPAGSDQDFVEFKLAGSVPVGPATVGATVFWSDNFYGGTGNATYVELNGSSPIGEKFSVSGAVGHQDVDYDGDYTTWNLGVGYALTDFLGVDLRYHDTNEHDFGDLYESRVVLGLKAAF